MTQGVGGVSNAGQVGTSSNVSGGGLTPDAVMLYCAAQLNHLDDSIQQQMAQQQAARGAQDKLGKLKALLAGDVPANATDEKKQIIQAMKEAYDSLPPNDPGREQLNGVFKDFIKTASFADSGADLAATGDKYNLATLDGTKLNELAQASPVDAAFVADSEMKVFAGKVDPILNDVGKGAELEMINLQSMVSQRQMAVQIATQLISKLNETISTVTSNLKGA